MVVILIAAVFGSLISGAIFFFVAPAFTLLAAVAGGVIAIALVAVWMAYVERRRAVSAEQSNGPQPKVSATPQPAELRPPEVVRVGSRERD